MANPILVFDLGGTKVAAGIMLPDHTIIHRRQLPTLAEQGAAAIFHRLVQLGNAVLSDTTDGERPVAIGVATGGQVDAESGTVVHATELIPGWTGFALGPALQEALGLPTFVENDANCFTLAEAVLGAGRGYRHLLVVAIGTGVGGGIMIDGKLYSGWQGKAGEVGHFSLVPVDGRPCSCGRTGCLESYTATRIIVAQSGYPSIQALATEYQAGKSILAVDEAAEWLGIGLASLAHIVGPEVIVIGGSVGLLGERYLTFVRAGFLHHTMPSYRAIPLHLAELAADSGLLGAGILAQRHL
ncbi:MAG TPA: ROK family protein [Caldilineaceae bacterium]|nr:ROK family protein [Caldilineaceae bacterium]